MAHIRVTDQIGPLQHVYVVDRVEGCELETMIGALHGTMLYRVQRDAHGQAVLQPVEGNAKSLADAVERFQMMCVAPDAPAATDEAPPALISVPDEAPPA